MTSPGLPDLAGVLGVVLADPAATGLLAERAGPDGPTLLAGAVRTLEQVTAVVVVVGPPPRRAAGDDSGSGSDSGSDPGSLAGSLADAVAAALGLDDLPTTCGALLVHDPLCPLADADHLRTVATGAAGRGWEPTAAVHPVTDTIKVLRDGPATPGGSRGRSLAATVDRERLRVVTTPVVVPVDRAARVPVPADAAALVRSLRRTGPVTLVGAPPQARRVHDVAGLQLALALRASDHRSG